MLQGRRVVGLKLKQNPANNYGEAPPDAQRFFKLACMQALAECILLKP